jgi:hypothetical protein
MKHKLISVALIAILLFMILGNSIGCTSATTYTLTITSTDGGNVTTPAEGSYTCNASQVVNLTATADSGYRFVNWTGGGTDIGNATAATTTITMNAAHTVIAHFALGVFIANVPDTNWTAANPPNYCAPLAMVNILGYWDEVKGLLNAQNVTAWLQPSNLTTVANYVGYFMDTNNAEAANPRRGNDGDGHAGTYAKDILMLTGGKLDYVRWDAGNMMGTPPPVLPPTKLGHNWTGLNDYCNAAPPVGFPFIKAEIDAGRPLVVCFRWWTLNFSTNVTDPQSGKVISVYQFGAQSNNSTPPNPAENWTGSYGEYYIGHAVTGVGYILNWDPDGSGGPIPSANWTIVHDTWATTPENIAVPWISPSPPGPWNSSHSVLP